VLEYEVKEAREESVALRDSHKSGDDSVDLLQTRISQLREVVEEKEQIVEELRYELKARDEEIERVRIGAGIADLEAEKQRLLKDFYDKNREAEELKKQLDEAHRQAGALDGQLQALGSIEAHPGYGALKARLDELEAGTTAMRAELARYTPDDKKRLEAQVAELKARNAEFDTKLSEARDEKSALYGTAKKLDGIVEASLKADEIMKQIEANVAMLKNYMGDVEKRTKGSDAGESTILMKDLIKVMEGDLKSAQKSLSKAIKS
jgi:predicted RNase H-like nuclease (RuvC/YqgF family)